MILNIPIHRIIRVLLFACIGTEIFLLSGDIIINYGKLTEYGMIRRFFNIAREDSLASWFGTTQTLLTGITIWFLFLLVRAEGKKAPWSWAVIAAFFCYMAIDDGAQIHERVGSAARRYFSSGGTGDEHLLSDYPSYAWQIIFLPLFGGMGLFMALFLRRELSGGRGLFFFAAGIACYGIAVVLDFIEGLPPEDPANPLRIIRKILALGIYDVEHFTRVFEEFLEMVGTTMFWAAFLKRIGSIRQEIKLIITD